MISNAKFSLSLFFRSIVGTFLSLLVFLMMGFLINYTAGRVIIAIITIFFYCCLIYACAWNQAFKDANYARFGHITENLNRGLICGLYASIPNFLIAAIYYIARFGLSKAVFGNVNFFTRCFYFPFIIPIEALADSFAPIIAICSLLMAVSAFIGYRMGNKDISIIERLVYKNIGKKGKQLSENKHKKLEK